MNENNDDVNAGSGVDVLLTFLSTLLDSFSPITLFFTIKLAVYDAAIAPAGIAIVRGGLGKEVFNTSVNPAAMAVASQVKEYSSGVPVAVKLAVVVVLPAQTGAGTTLLMVTGGAMIPHPLLP